MLQVEKVCNSSDEENLQPFKGKMDTFLTQGKHLNNLFQLFSKQLHYKPLLTLRKRFKCFSTNIGCAYTADINFWLPNMY